MDLPTAGRLESNITYCSNCAAIDYFKYSVTSVLSEGTTVAASSIVRVNKEATAIHSYRSGTTYNKLARTVGATGLILNKGHSRIERSTL